ncbi:MAG: hypothetical protein HFH66_16375 [Lachnospiraceae bacterium]|uniref:PD-(D/E)XK nuclease domain-containing protein n=1 Tax=uncultured Clostridium sp. TaxID=59620 RepID=UPI00351CC34D|nr:hypothetical protein [Lachnospiraceae bacterium]
MGCKAEQESGEGYPDILVKAVEKRAGCVFEIKYAEDGRFDETCRKAMQQIKDKKYADIFKTGMCGKNLFIWDSFL